MKKKLTQIHGKTETFRAETLDQVWGDTGLSKYKTLDETVYAAELADLNLSDLQNHSIKIGIIPIDSREQLTKRLLKEFRSFANNYRIPKSDLTPPKTPSKMALKILSEGR